MGLLEIEKHAPLTRILCGLFMAKNPDDLDEYRARVFAAMREAGLTIDQWDQEYKEELARHPTGRARPFTTIQPPRFGKIQKLRPGFEEFIVHPAHGRPVPRCQAAKKRSGGKIQCAKFAVRGCHVCRTHGGGKGSGQLTDEGRKNQIAAVTVHGKETLAMRTSRAQALGELRLIEQQARQIGIMTSKGSRGPYYKANRIGKPMEHLRRKKKS